MPLTKPLATATPAAHGADFHGDMRKGAYLQRRAVYHAQATPAVTGSEPGTRRRGTAGKAG